MLQPEPGVLAARRGAAAHAGRPPPAAPAAAAAQEETQSVLQYTSQCQLYRTSYTVNLPTTSFRTAV